MHRDRASGPHSSEEAEKRQRQLQYPERRRFSRLLWRISVVANSQEQRTPYWRLFGRIGAPWYHWRDAEHGEKCQLGAQNDSCTNVDRFNCIPLGAVSHRSRYNYVKSAVAAGTSQVPCQGTGATILLVSTAASRERWVDIFRFQANLRQNPSQPTQYGHNLLYNLWYMAET